MITDRYAESEPNLDKMTYRQTLKTYMYLWRSNTGDGLKKKTLRFLSPSSARKCKRIVCDFLKVYKIAFFHPYRKNEKTMLIKYL